MQAGGCVFCDDIIKKRDGTIIHEDQDTLVFMDYAPVEDGHILVIPKKHFENIFDIDEENYLRVHNLVRKISSILVSSLKADGLNIGQNNGACANQVVMHYHVHMIPRWCKSSPPNISTKGRFARKPLSWERKLAEKDDLEKVAAIIKNGLENFLSS